MNIIQEALNRQGIDANWQGPEPTTAEEITLGYLTEDYAYGLPRMIRTEVDSGSAINLVQLRLDFTTLKSSMGDERRIAAIKAKAGQLIESKVPDWKQRNIMARSIEIVNNSKGRDMTPQERAEELAINQVWGWIKLVRATSDAAENEGKTVDQINWPTPGF